MNSFRANLLPYCLLKAEGDTIGGWIVLNRRYKFLGANPRKDYSSQDIPLSSRIEKLTVEQAMFLSWESLPVEEFSVDEKGFVTYPIWIHLYNDGCLPEDGWDTYIKKLEVLRDLPTMG